MKLRVSFVYTLALNSVILVGVVFYVSETFHKLNKVIRQAEITFFTYNNFHLHEHGATQRRMELPGMKPFIHLTETKQCLPANLATSSQIGDPKTCDCDVIVLRFRARCRTPQDNQSHVSYLFDPKTGWASGRNVLFFAALNGRPGYHY